MAVMVPQPGPYLAGMSAELHCSVTLDEVLDTAVGVEVVWQRNGKVLGETERVEVLPARLTEDYRYESLLRFNTLSSSSDNGDYICTGTVFSTSKDTFLTSTTGRITISFSVSGNAP